MARRTFGSVRGFFDLKGQRQARAALTRALPELDDRERDVLLRQSRAWGRQLDRRERRARGLSSVDFCRRLTFEGWENLHNANGAPLFLMAPLGSLEVARRVLDLYHAGREHALMIPVPGGQETVHVELFRQTLPCVAHPARQALATEVPAVWILAIPGGKDQWTIRLQSPIPPFTNDTAVSLSQRYLDVLDQAIRCHPSCWPWGELG